MGGGAGAAIFSPNFGWRCNTCWREALPLECRGAEVGKLNPTLLTNLFLHLFFLLFFLMCISVFYLIGGVVSVFFPVFALFRFSCILSFFCLARFRCSKTFSLHLCGLRGLGGEPDFQGF